MVPRSKKIKTAENVFTIIEKIEALDQPTCSELAEQVDLSVSTIHNYLSTLKETGYVVENDSRYRLSLRFLQRGRAVRNSYPIMHAAVKPIDILSKSINEYISVFAIEGEKVVMIHEANSHHAVQVPTPFLGEPFHLAKSPQGKVVLAHMADSLRQRVLSDTELDDQAVERLQSELDTIRNEGIGVDEGQAHENIWAIAAPVRAGDTIHGSITISTVQHRLNDQRARQELPDLLRQTVKEVEHRLSTYDFTDLYSTW